MPRQKELIAHLLDAFPPKHFSGETAMHNCADCAGIRATLDGATWWAIPGPFIRDHIDQLPLLTPAAYKAFFPAWLREAVLNPNGEIANCVLRHLEEGTTASLFSRQQSYAVIQIAKWISEQDPSGSDDPIKRETMTRINRLWNDPAN